MSTLDDVATRRRSSIDTSRAWQGHLALLLLAFFAAGAAEADLSQTGQWRGPYLLGLPLTDLNYSKFPPAVGSHVAVLKGPADSSRVILFGESGSSQKIRVWSFVPRPELTVPVPHYSPSAANLHGVVLPERDLFSPAGSPPRVLREDRGGIRLSGQGFWRSSVGY